MPYTVRRKTIWLATSKSFYRKNRLIEVDVPVYDFRAWRVPVNLAYRLMREGYAMREETAAAWAFDHKPMGSILRGVTREPIHTFPNDVTMEQVIEYTRAILVREEMANLSCEALSEPLCNHKSGTGCREFQNYQEWYAAAAAVH